MGWMRVGLVLLVLLPLVGCRGGQATAAQAAAKTYKLRGKVVAVDTANGEVTVKHQAIPGFMEAMTMPYRVEDRSVAGELHPGDLITADLLADEDAAGPMNLRLRNVVVTAQANPNALPPIQYHVPKAGETVPDFRLLNQSGRHIDLGQYRGKVVLLTFIYTRCPLADYCPRMSGNFAEIDKGLKADPAAFRKTHLLSVSFDPKYDTPQVLRSYGGAHTGMFTEEQFQHWEFAAPSVADLAALEQWFDVGVTPDQPGDPTVLTHSLSTLIIGKDGKVVAWLPTNDWKPAEVLARVKAAALS